MTIWQLGAGEPGRYYSEFLIRHDLACLGPGNPGPYSHKAYSTVLKSHKSGAIDRFKNSLQQGDLVLLREGSKVVALGTVSSAEYCWDPRYDDLNGWGLQHSRRIFWHTELQDEVEKLQADGSIFGKAKRLSMFTRIKIQSHRSKIVELVETVPKRQLKELPQEPSALLTSDDLSRELFSAGLSHKATDDLVRAIFRQRKMLNWYRTQDHRSGRPSEHEVVAFMILPILLALGWSEQLLAIEWKRIDLAGFSKTPTNETTCTMVCEAKCLGYGLEDAFRQAKRYVSSLKLHHCFRIVTTDGERFYLHRKRGEEWSSSPEAYMNLDKIRLRNVDGTGALEFLMALR
jgi:hypothetical protein